MRWGHSCHRAQPILAFVALHWGILIYLLHQGHSMPSRLANPGLRCPALGKFDFAYRAGAICCNHAKGLPLLLACSHLPPSHWVLGHSHFLVPKPLNAIAPRPTNLIIVSHAIVPRPTIWLLYLVPRQGQPLLILPVISCKLQARILALWNYSTMVMQLHFRMRPILEECIWYMLPKQLHTHLHMRLDLEDCICWLPHHISMSMGQELMRHLRPLSISWGMPQGIGFADITHSHPIINKRFVNCLPAYHYHLSRTHDDIDAELSKDNVTE